MVLPSARIEAYNPGPMTGSGNHTYLLRGHDGDGLLIDAGTGDPRHLRDVAARLGHWDATLAAVLVTHGHADHISGANALASAYPDARFFKWPRPEEDDRHGVEWWPLGTGASFVLSDASRLQTLHTPGHSPDHVVFWHEPSRSLIAGDLVLPGASVVIQWSRGGDMSRYLESLRAMIALEPEHLLPAHGPEVERALPLLQETLSHRLLRERQVGERLRAGLGSVEAIVESIYHGLTPAHVVAARENVRAHLEKLRSDGLAAREGDRWRPVRS